MRDAHDAQAMRLAFAEAVAKPWGQALLLTEDNRPRPGEQWVPLEQAAASGQAFAVEPCEHVVAVDIDEAADREWATRMRAGLEPRGCRFVLVSSGRDGHQHLWVLMPHGWNYEFLKAQMEEVAGAPRTWNQVRRNATRPPLSPHRLGGHAEIVEPGPATALQLFRSHRPQGIPVLARKILRESDPQAVVTRRGVVQRGRSIYRAAVSLVNARMSERDLADLLRGNKNGVTSKYWDLPSDRRDDYVAEKWKAACHYVRKHPPAAAERDSVKALQSGIAGLQWSPRTGATDRAVYAALLELGNAAASLRVNASVRQLSELACLSTGAVRAALTRLVEAGYVTRAEEPGRLHRHAYSYLLRTDVGSKSCSPSHTWPYYGGPTVRCIEESRSLTDIFSNGTGLGLSARETWEALPTQPTKTAEVVALRPAPLQHDTVLGHLRRLQEVGLAGRKGHRWWRQQPELDQLDRLAGMLGVRGKTQRRISTYVREREDYLERFYPGENSADPAA